MLQIILPLLLFVQFEVAKDKASLDHEVATEAVFSRQRTELEHLVLNKMHQAVDKDELDEHEADRCVDAASVAGIEPVHYLT